VARGGGKAGERILEPDEQRAVTLDQGAAALDPVRQRPACRLAARLWAWDGMTILLPAGWQFRLPIPIQIASTDGRGAGLQ
jgi:hypothetical protein